MSNIITKMTVKGVGANPSKAKAENRKVPLARIFGTAAGVVHKVDNRGEPITGITGNFEGVNLETGEVYSSGVLYLPGGIHEMLLNAVDQGEEDAKGKPTYNSVQFAFDISAVPATNPIGYSYEATQLIEASKADPMAELRASLPAMPALPAPAKADDAAAPAATEEAPAKK